MNLTRVETRVRRAHERAARVRDDELEARNIVFREAFEAGVTVARICELTGLSDAGARRALWGPTMRNPQMRGTTRPGPKASR